MSFACNVCAKEKKEMDMQNNENFRRHMAYHYPKNAQEKELCDKKIQEDQQTFAVMSVFPQNTGLSLEPINTVTMSKKANQTANLEHGKSDKNKRDFAAMSKDAIDQETSAPSKPKPVEKLPRNSITVKDAVAKEGSENSDVQPLAANPPVFPLLSSVLQEQLDQIQCEANAAKEAADREAREKKLRVINEYFQQRQSTAAKNRTSLCQECDKLAARIADLEKELEQLRIQEKEKQQEIALQDLESKRIDAEWHSATSKKL